MKAFSLSFVLILGILLNHQVVLSMETVRIGGSPYPISTFEENNKIVGLDFDLVEAILKEAGITNFQRVLKPWKRIVHDLDVNNVDMVVPMVYTKERQKKYFLTPSIRTRHNIVLVKKNFSRTIKTILDLAGLTVGKCDGYAYQKNFLEAAQKGLFNTTYCLDNEMGLRKLKAGRSHAFMIGEDTALILIKNLGLKGEFKYTDYKAVKASHVGIKRSKPELYQKFLKGLEKAKKKGLIEKIIQDWKSRYAIK